MARKAKAKQTVRVQIDMFVDLDGKYTPSQVADIVKRNAMLAFRCNSRQTLAIRYRHTGYQTEDFAILKPWKDVKIS